MAYSGILPEGFEDLVPFVDYWAVETAPMRRSRLLGASAEQAKQFYDVMLERSPAVMDYLDEFPVDAIPPTAAPLMRLLLALPHAAMAVELRTQPIKVIASPHSLTLARGARPFD